MGTCKECKFWTRQQPPHVGWFGFCATDEIPHEPMVPFDKAGMEAGILLTFQDFGCTEHQPTTGDPDAR